MKAKKPLISESRDHHLRFRKMKEWRALRDARQVAAKA